MRERAKRGVTLIELLVVMAILAILAAGIGAACLNGGTPRIKMAEAQIAKLSLALDAYHRAFRAYPPDTGYGLGMESSPGTYDPGSLWRYLTKRVRDPRTKRLRAPFLDEWRQENLMPYGDAQAGPSFFLADPWGSPYGFVADPKRVGHDAGRFDLFSAGADRLTGSDADGAAANLAYNGLEDDGNGTVDDAGELGGASRNGTLADDINNWTPQ